MTRRQRSRAITIAVAIGFVLTILNIWRRDGLAEAANALAWFIGCMVALILIIVWVEKGR